jgi:hypothetical protein
MQSYTLEGNELNSTDNIIYIGLRRAEERVYVSPSTAGTEARITDSERAPPLPFEVAGSLTGRAKELSVLVSTSRESQLRVNTRMLSALNADQANILTLLVCPLV